MSQRSRTLLWLGLVMQVCLQSALSSGQTGSAAAPVRYVVSLASHQQHLLHIQMQLSSGQAQRQVQLPVWNALYQVRDFSQNVNWLRAKRKSGEALQVKKLDKTTWQIDGAADGVTVEYEILADEPGPYGAEANASHAFFNLAEILMYSPEMRSSSSVVLFKDVPAGWKIATPLKTSGAEYRADTYDQLVDSPVEMGTFEESDFDVDGAHYRVVVDADRSDYDMAKIAADVHKIVVGATTWMEDRPFQTYLFLYHFPKGPGGGGMEHADGTAIDVGARALKDNPPSLNGVTAHEFFHLWNVKRIRPQSLEPIDYTRENYTRALWFSEGVTSTVEDIILARAGLEDEPSYLRKLGEQISELQSRPAHRTQSAEESSLDAWLEKYLEYRQPERSISYYNKGELLGVMLDLAVREGSHGSCSLRNVLQWMNQNYARQGKFFPDSTGVQQAAETACHLSLAPFFQKYVSGVEEIPWDDVFRPVGIRVVPQKMTVADLGFSAIRNFDSPPIVNRLAAGTEADKAGLAVGDALIEINGRPAVSDYQRKLDELRPGDALRLRLRRRGVERQLEWKLGSREQIEFVMKDVENVTAQQRAMRNAWLKGE